MHGLVYDLAEQSWAVKAEPAMKAVLGLKEFVCDSVEQTCTLKAEL